MTINRFTHLVRRILSVPAMACPLSFSPLPVTYFYTDGSCLSSTSAKYGGWAWCMVKKNQIIQEQSGAECQTTNQRMELSAVHHALSYMWDHSDEMEEPVCFVSDSKYVLNGVQSWSKEWVRNGFLTSRGKPVEHVDLWKSILYMNHPSIQWQWVKGHSGDRLHDHVDQVARSSAISLQQKDVK